MAPEETRAGDVPFYGFVSITPYNCASEIPREGLSRHEADFADVVTLNLAVTIGYFVENNSEMFAVDGGEGPDRRIAIHDLLRLDGENELPSDFEWAFN
ncbi:unnamed protein product [Clonostachys solani]|uniref:Uncharacterized protein n=1 Tax=Clonostachys solani TaxID=160281 RepID=A0A9P0ENI4_9HYPO|nr:unnamed protein product [Clonostachys solani]